MAAHTRSKNEFTEDEKYHNLMTWLICIFVSAPIDSSESYDTDDNHDYTNIRIDTEGLQSEDTNKPYVAHVQNDAAHIQQVRTEQTIYCKKWKIHTPQILVIAVIILKFKHHGFYHRVMHLKKCRRYGKNRFVQKQNHYDTYHAGVVLILLF